MGVKVHHSEEIRPNNWVHCGKQNVGFVGKVHKRSFNDLLFRFWEEFCAIQFKCLGANDESEIYPNEAHTINHPLQFLMYCKFST